MLSCDIDWMLHFINGWKNEWMLDVNEECRVMLGGGGFGPNELPPSRGWPYLVENIKLFSKQSEAQ